MITDAYLAALALRNGGRLATFDRNVPIAALVSGRHTAVELIGA
jgi:predicted nucleic acid-binding protein